MGAVSADLLRVLDEGRARPAPPGAYRLAEAIRARHGDAVKAILVYGSCYRTGDERGVFDLYVLTDGYRAFHRRWGPALTNRALPPNVYYLELPEGPETVRAKYAVLTLEGLARGTSRRAFHSYFWGRFAQPVGLLYAADAAVAARVRAGLADAVTTFAGRVLPLLPRRFDAGTLWRRGLGLCYAAELRAERAERATQLYEADASHYERVTRAAIAALPFPVTPVETADGVRYEAAIPAWRRAAAHLGWIGRRTVGKALSIPRLAKGLFTFAGGPEYIAWKIERHSGVAVDLSPRARRHPLLAGWVVVWRLYRRGAFR